MHLNAQQQHLPRFGQLDTRDSQRSPTVAVNLASTYDEKVDVADGTFQINANTSIEQLKLRKNGTVRVRAGNTLEITANELIVQEGLIDGNLRGPSLLRKIANGRVELRDLGEFNGELVVEQGVLNLNLSEGGAFGASEGIVRVGEQDAAVFLSASGFDEKRVFKKDIFLNNAYGIDHTGGLFFSRLCCNTPEIRLEGRLDLGTIGSMIGSPDSQSTADNVTVEIAAPISGGSLTTRGRRLLLKFLSGRNTYSGVTDIREGTIELGQTGTIMTSAAIVLREGPETRDGTLIISNAESTLTNRIGDTIPIQFHGGSLDVEGETNETIGAVHLVEGESGIDLTRSSRLGGFKRIDAASLRQGSGSLPVGQSVGRRAAARRSNAHDKRRHLALAVRG